MNKYSYTEDQLKKLLPPRNENSNKGSCGRVLIIGGSPCMSGAPYFSAKAAYRMGSGLVEVMTHEKNRIIIQTLLPEAVLSTWDDGELDLVRIEQSIKKATVIAIGMGLSMSSHALEILKFTLKTRTCPIIIDADALNLISHEPSLAEMIGDNAAVTPHPLEASRLSGIETGKIVADPPLYAKIIADKLGTVCLVKDHRTAVAAPCSDDVYINMSGNSGMSTGGSGDVLDGVIAGLVAQGMPILDATCLGAYIHGLAGDAAAAKLSEYSLIASDIVDNIPTVLKNAVD